MPKFVSIRPAYKILTSNYSSRTLLFFASYADFLHKNYVSIGRKLGLNPISLGIMVDRNKDVPSCTIEEYEILKYIGNKLGQEGMPPIHYPKALTKEEILEHFHDGSSLSFPFTEKDIYGW